MENDQSRGGIPRADRTRLSASVSESGFTMGWIHDEELWLEMLDARNRMSHTYKYQDAMEIYNRLSAFLPELESLRNALLAV